MIHWYYAADLLLKFGAMFSLLVLAVCAMDRNEILRKRKEPKHKCTACDMCKLVAQGGTIEIPKHDLRP